MEKGGGGTDVEGDRSAESCNEEMLCAIDMKGEKTVEYRQYSDFYINRLYDKDVMKFHEEHKENEEIDGEYGRYGMLDAIRRVRKIHFHDYSNTWYMDVEVLDNNYIYLNKKDQEGMNEV